MVSVMKEGEAMVTKRMTRQSSNFNRVDSSTLVRKDYRSIAQHEAEIRQRDNFRYGSYGAAIAMCLMFVVLSVGCVMGLW